MCVSIIIILVNILPIKCLTVPHPLIFLPCQPIALYSIISPYAFCSYENNSREFINKHVIKSTTKAHIGTDLLPI